MGSCPHIYKGQPAAFSITSEHNHKLERTSPLFLVAVRARTEYQVLLMSTVRFTEPYIYSELHIEPPSRVYRPSSSIRGSSPKIIQNDLRSINTV